MQILIVNTRHYPGGGDSVYAFALAELLRSHGQKVSFFAMQGKSNLPDANEDLFVSHIDYRAMNERKNLITGMQVMARSIYSTEARQKFSVLLDRVKPDVVHLQNIHAHITPSIILEAKRRGIPVVWTIHDYKLVCPNSHFFNDKSEKICEACSGGRFWQATRKRCKKGSRQASGMASLEAYVHQVMNVRTMVDAFLCPSAFLRDKLLENGFDECKTHHLPLFLPESAFSRCSSDQGYILFLGKLEPLKGIYPLLEAARKAPRVKVVLAGNVEEPLRSRLPMLVSANVKYVGFKIGKELDDLRSGARSLVLPSLWYENQPLSILEAFAAGKPVIASDLGGMRELVGDNERGQLVPKGDADALARAMTWMVDHPGDVRNLGDSAYKYAKVNHSAGTHYQHVMKTYQEVLM